MRTQDLPQLPTATSSVEVEHSYRPQSDRVHKAIAKRSFATLATVSPAGRPHVAGVLFKLVDGAMYVNTLRSSRKVRNMEANPHVAVCIPVRRLPVGPPSTIQFQGRATVLDLDCTEITNLVETKSLKSLTGHGELDLPDGCFLRIDFGSRLITYGLGMSIPKLIGDPLSAGGIVSTS